MSPPVPHLVPAEVALADRRADPDAAVAWPAHVVNPLVGEYLTGLADYAVRASYPGKRCVSYAIVNGVALRVTVERLTPT